MNKKILILMVLLVILIIFFIMLTNKESFKIEEDLSGYYVEKCVPNHAERLRLKAWQDRRAVPNGYAGSKCVCSGQCYPGLKCVYPQDTNSLFAQYSDLIPTSGICA